MNERGGYSFSEIQNMEYRAVGGWLLFFCFTLVVLSPLQCAWSIWKDIEHTPLDTYPVWLRLLVFVLYGTQVVLVLLGAIVGVYLWRLHRRGVWLAKAFLVLQFIAVFSTSFLVFGLAALAGMASDAWEETWPGLLKSTLYCSIWWLYLNRSHRVRRTYELKYGAGT